MGVKSSGFEVLLNRSFCRRDSKTTGLIKALSEEVLCGYENVLKNGCSGNECMEVEAEGGTDDHVFQACACQGGSSKKWAIKWLKDKWVAYELSSDITCS